jgi:hypothetical protein
MGVLNILIDKFTTIKGDLAVRRMAEFEENIQGSDEILSSSKYAYFLNDTVEVMQDLTIIDIDVQEDSKIMDSPVESGIVISDHRIKNPIEIVVNCTVPKSKWEETYKEIKFWYDQSGKTFLTIRTKADAYPDMQMIAIPHKETPDTVSRLFFELRFRSILFAKFVYIRMPVEKVKIKADATTVDTGKKLMNDINYTPAWKNSSQNTVFNVTSP